jgi:hypothetical protein
MLPILRIIPVGGVTLAIVILLLALSPPGGSRPSLPQTMMPAHGALIARADHPEWRQLLVKAALRRADELSQLRQLPDTPIQTDNKSDNVEIATPQEADEVAGVPVNQDEAQPEEVTGTITQSPKATIPVDIGEASSTELPLAPKEELPPVIRTPQRSTPSHESMNTPEPAKAAQKAPKAAPEPAKPEPRRRAAHYSRRARVTSAAPAQFNFLEAFFATFTVNQQTPKQRR